MGLNSSQNIFNGTATTLAIGGATLGSNALAVTGTSSIGLLTVTTTASGAGVIVNAATTGYPVVDYRIDNSAKAYVGVARATNDLVTGSAANDLIARSNGASFVLSTDSGTTAAKLTVPAAATLQLGAAAAASPVAQTLQSQPSRAGTDSNVGGANLTVRSAAGTGTGTISSLILQSPVAVASGTDAQTQTTGLTIKQGCFVSTGYTVATLPATPATGSRAHVTDANATTFLSTVAGGGANVVPVFYDGTNWVIG